MSDKYQIKLSNAIEAASQLLECLYNLEEFDDSIKLLSQKALEIGDSLDLLKTQEPPENAYLEPPKGTLVLHEERYEIWEAPSGFFEVWERDYLGSYFKCHLSEDSSAEFVEAKQVAKNLILGKS